MNTNNLETTALALVASGKGILAADESTPTIAKRFAQSIAICGDEVPCSSNADASLAPPAPN